MCSFFTSLLAWHYCWQKQHMLQAGHSFVGCPKVIAKCHMSLVPSKLAHHMRGPRGPFLMAGKLRCRGRNCHDCAGFSRHERMPARSKHVEILPNRSDLKKLRACMKHGSQRCSEVFTFKGCYQYMIEKDHRTLTNKPQVASWRLKSKASQTSSLADVHVHIWSPPESSEGRQRALRIHPIGGEKLSPVWNMSEGQAKLRQQKSPGELCALVGLMHAHAQNITEWFYLYNINQYHHISSMFRVYTFQVSVLFLSFSESKGPLSMENVIASWFGMLPSVHANHQVQARN